MAEQSRRLVETLRPLYEQGNRAWNEGDFRGAYGGLPDDFEFRPAATWPNARERLRGPDEIVAFFEDFHETFPDAHSDLLEFIEVDDRRVIAGLAVTGTGSSSGASTEMEVWQLWEVSEELMPIRMSEYASRDAALNAAGIDGSNEGAG